MLLNISLLSPIAGILESIICKKLFTSFGHIISDKQHGFVPGRSVTTNLIQLSEEVIDSFQHKCQVDVVYLDLVKASNTLDHKLLLEKLYGLGISGVLHNWLNTYLIGREQTVLVNGKFSNAYKVSSGVAQGSRLGPLLFTLFINDLTKVIQHSNLELYADDCRISRKILNSNDVTKLQMDINAVLTWVKKKKLNINVEKCQKITFSRLKNILKTEYYI